MILEARGVRSLWSWNYRWLWATLCDCWKSNSGPSSPILKTKSFCNTLNSVFLTVWGSPQLILFHLLFQFLQVWSPSLISSVLRPFLHYFLLHLRVCFPEDPKCGLDTTAYITYHILSLAVSDKTLSHIILIVDWLHYVIILKCFKTLISIKMMLHKYIPRPYNKTPKRNNLVNPFYLNIDLHSHILILYHVSNLNQSF